jgi:glycosyltransferase involved in cell wall biosynthesis
MQDKPHFSIITPSFNMLSFLEMCAASIADQEEAAFEHIVVDGGSGDGTTRWLEQQPHIKSLSEKDSGMYDAINKGFARARGDILAYLNCDEQYLPGTLAFVKTYFEHNPAVDMIFGDMVLIRPDGALIAFRKGYPPRWFYILASFLYVPTCTMFFRRKIIDDGFYFDLNFKANADADFVVRLLRSRYVLKHVKKYLAAFTMTGKNLSSETIAQKESAIMYNQSPGYIKKLRWLLNGLRFLEKWCSGAYFQKKPLEYSVYVKDNGTQRKHFSAANPSFKWKWE